MATRKNLKKTGKKVKPRKGGSKKRKTVRKGGMWPFTSSCMGSGCVSVPETVELDIETPEQLFEAIRQMEIIKYKKKRVLAEYEKDELSHNYNILHTKAANFIWYNNETLIYYLSNLSDADFKTSMTKIINHFNITNNIKTQINNMRKKTQMNNNNLGFNKSLTILKTQRKTSQNTVLNNPDLVGIISSFGLILTPPMLFKFLIKINPESLSETERSQLEAFKEYYNKNKSVVNDAIEEYYIKGIQKLDYDIGQLDARIEEQNQEAIEYEKRGVRQTVTKDEIENIIKETYFFVEEKKN